MASNNEGYGVVEAMVKGYGEVIEEENLSSESLIVGFGGC